MYPLILIANTRRRTAVKQFITAGLDRLLSFEATNGGFALFGGKEGSAVLSAYGLQEFADMAGVFPRGSKVGMNREFHDRNRREFWRCWSV